jgi:hypothetical protein
MSKLRRSVIFTSATLAVFVLIWFLESMVQNFIAAGMPHGAFIPELYPNLALKIEQWGSSGMMDILATIKFRFLIMAGFGWYLFAHSSQADEAGFSEKKAIWLVKLFFILQLLFVPDLLNELRIRTEWQALFHPVGLSVLWLGQFPSYAVFQILAIVLFGLSAWLVLAQWDPDSPFPVLAALAVWLIWVYLLSVFFGFGKIDHTYASMFSGMTGMLCFLEIWRRSFSDIGFGFRIFQAFIWGCYFFSGLEKIFLSGVSWAGSEHFRVLAALHPGFGADWISAIPFSNGLLWLALLFQIGSALQWKFPKWGYINAAGGLLFHIGTWFLFGIGGLFHPWIVMLVFLWPHTARR